MKKSASEGPYFALSMPKNWPFPYGVVCISGEPRLVAMFEDQFPAEEYVEFMNRKFRSKRK